MALGRGTQRCGAGLRIIIIIIMKTIGLIPSQVLISLDKDAEGHWLNVPEGQTVVPLIKTAPPAFNAATQKLVPAEPLWFSDRVERQLSIVNLTQDELDAAALPAKKTSLTNAIATLRTWANDADASNPSTNAQALTALNVLLDRMGPFMRNMADLLEYLRVNKP